MEFMKNFADEIYNDKLVKKYIRMGTWLSGSSTNVYPITIWEKSREVVVQIKTKRNVFNKLLERYKNKYENIEYCYFDKTDDSCPSRLVFKFKESV